MRVLNVKTEPRSRVIPAEPDLLSFSVRGQDFVYDCNSLLLAVLDTEEDKKKVQGAQYKPVFPHYSATPPRYLVIEACHACNLACTYCAVQAYQPGADMMELKVAKDAIHRLFPKDGLSKASIGFFGGEPLLNWSLMEQLTLYFEGLCHPRRPRFHVTTNATLIDDKKATFFRDHNYSLIVSLDGPEEIHNQCRQTRDGKGSFQAVTTALEILFKAGLSSHITLRATYTPDTMDTLVERAKFLNGLRYKGWANWVSIEPAFLSESQCIDPKKTEQGITEDQIKLLQNDYLRVADWYIGEVQSGRKPVFHNISKFIERLLYCIPGGTECGGGVGYLSVNSKGDLFACHREGPTMIGNLYRGGIDEEKRAPWQDNRIYHRKWCMSCPIRYVCGGGCRELSLCENGDIHCPLQTECSLKRIFFSTAVHIMSVLGPKVLQKIVPEPQRPKGTQSARSPERVRRNR